MGPENIGDFLREGLFVVISIVAVVLVPGLIIGLIVATFQAATQINEQTLSFLPRLVVTLLCILFFGPWIIGKLVTYAQTLYMNIPYLIS
ncbi:MAG: flagellar biosynthetic protein FliQ [Oceanicoccus sp.]|jgi:flagellar biosynthetic protein FliQ